MWGERKRVEGRCEPLGKSGASSSRWRGGAFESMAPFDLPLGLNIFLDGLWNLFRASLGFLLLRDFEGGAIVSDQFSRGTNTEL